MNIIENIINSLQFPFKNWVKMIILGIILVIPIVNFIGLGYYLRIIKTTLMGLDDLPDFEDIVKLFIDGVKLLIVSIIYTIIPLIFYIFSFVFPGRIFLIMAIISTLIISIFAYMGVVNMVYHDIGIIAAVRYHEILGKIRVIGWIKYMLWWIALILIIIFVGSTISIAGGILVYFILGFWILLVGYSYLLIFQARSIALTFAN
ncbi:MAG: DUF4013 domain-containing protein [Methanobacterium sp.]|nr:DUF4013 domain-containing protein [Methanobacterium sp.]